MMSRTTLRIVLLVSCAHALVHVYELSLPSVEQEIAHEFHPESEEAGKKMTGWLSTCWRLPWGLGALGAGWLVDRFGARRLLAIYLLGCAGMCILAGLVVPLSLLFVAMFSMGTFACIYHPAGLALISHETTASNRPRALGIHGIFGSAGIAAAPFLAASLLSNDGEHWRIYFWVLTIPGALLGGVFVWQAFATKEKGIRRSETPVVATEDDQANWTSFMTLCGFAVLQGFIYSAMMSFLPRYLSEVDLSTLQLNIERVSTKNYLAGGVLIIGCAGQYISGRMARPRLLEIQIAFIMLANAPCLLWMAFASGWGRLAAAGLFALVHFMNQPIYNSLIAKYTPRRRRSLCYGFSFAMAFGLGSFGALFHGVNQSDQIVYSVLAIIALAAGGIGLILWLQNRHADEAT